MARTFYSSYASTDSGQFRLKAVMYTAEQRGASDSAGMQIKVYCHVHDSFKSSHTAKFSGYKNNTTKVTKSKKVKAEKTFYLGSFTVKAAKVTKDILLTVNKKTVKIPANTIKNTKDGISDSTYIYPFSLTKDTTINGVPSVYEDDGATPVSYINTNKPTSWDITVSVSKGEADQPTSKIYLQQSNVYRPGDSDWTELRWENIKATSSSVHYTFNSIPISPGQPYKFRARASATTSGVEKFTDWEYSPQMWSIPSATDGVSIDTSLEYPRITWSASQEEIDSKSIRGWRIFQRGGLLGTWSILDDVYKPTTGTINYISNPITSRLDNNTIQYFKVVAFNYKDGFDMIQYAWEDSETEVEYQWKPDTPDVTGNNFYKVYWDANDTVTIEINDTAYMEDMHVLIESSIDETTWTQIANLEYPTNTYTDSSATLNTVYRIRYMNDAGYSGYSEIFYPAESVAPNPPLILAPMQNYFFIEDSQVQIKWSHQAPDGSPQKLAHVYIDNTLSYSGNDSSYIWDYSLYSAGNHTIKVRTQAINDLWSELTLKDITLVNKPTLNITSPSGTVVEFPSALDFTWTRALEKVNVRILDNNGNIAWTYEKFYSDDTSGSDSIPLMDFLFEPDVEYTIQVSGQFMYGIASSTTLVVATYEGDSDVQGALFPVTDEDENTAIAYITISRDNAEEEEEEEPIEEKTVLHAYLYRRSNGEKVLIGEVEENDTIADIYAPVNLQYNYELLQLFDDGTAASVVIDTMLESSYSYIYWGTNKDNIIKAIWNPTVSSAISRPEQQMVRYSGRKYPVLYDSKAREEKSTFVAELEYEDLQKVIDMMNEGGIGVWKSVQGRCYDATFDLNWQRVEAQYPIDLYRVTLNITRIEG